MKSVWNKISHLFINLIHWYVPTSGWKIVLNRQHNYHDNSKFKNVYSCNMCQLFNDTTLYLDPKVAAILAKEFYCLRLMKKTGILKYLNGNHVLKHKRFQKLMVIFPTSFKAPWKAYKQNKLSMKTPLFLKHKLEPDNVLELIRQFWKIRTKQG